MLKVSHITMTNKQRYLLTDVSFVLPAHGFCAITAKEKETEKAISYLSVSYTHLTLPTKRIV